jgi:hypothetical protein
VLHHSIKHKSLAATATHWIHMCHHFVPHAMRLSAHVQQVQASQEQQQANIQSDALHTTSTAGGIILTCSATHPLQML